MEKALCIKKDSAIGYQEILATNSETIELGMGNHFLLGRNGRGKTTLLRSLAGSIDFLAGGAQAKVPVIFLSEDLYFDREISAKQIFHSLLRKAQATEALEFAERIDLAVKKPYAELSTGNKRKLAVLLAEFTAAAISNPIIMLDEPYTGLDDAVRNAFRQYWEATAAKVCRIIIAHPDQDSFQLPSAITISEGHIIHRQFDPPRTWQEIRQQLS